MAAKTPKQKRQWVYVYLTRWVFKTLGPRIVQITSYNKDIEFSQETQTKLVKLIDDSNNLAKQIEENYHNNKPL